jgi:putative spermidine/putrescine transport system permease protein
MRRASLVVLTLIAIAPPLLVVAQSLSPGAYARVVDRYGSSLLFSIELSLSVVAATLLIAVPAAFAFARHPFRGSRALEHAAMLPLTLPGITVAVALIMAFGALRGGPLVLACGQMLYTIPYVIAVVTMALRTASFDELDAAARTLGAAPWQRFRRITLPLLRHPLAVAASIAFAVSWGEFNVTFLLATPLQMPFSAALYTAYTSETIPVAGAATAIFIAGALPFLTGMQRWMSSSTA